MPPLLDYWFLLPVGIAIAVLVMSAGVSGAALWVPVYLLWLGLAPALAFWLGLVTLLFGFGSGILRNFIDRSYDGALVRRCLLFSLPAALIAGWLAALLDQRALVLGFGIFLVLYSAAIGWSALRADSPPAEPGRNPSLWPRALIGGALTGLISIGIGIALMPAMLRHRSTRRPGAAVGSTVMVIFFTSFAAAVGRLRPAFVAVLSTERLRLAAILIWVVPAVIIGGQVGPRLAQKLRSERHARIYFSVVLLAVGIVTLIRGAHL